MEETMDQKVAQMINNLNELEKLRSWIKQARDQEMELRLKVCKTLFPEPKGGTNTAEIPGFGKVKAVYTTIIEVDKASLMNSRGIPENSDIPFEMLIDWKPALVNAVYKQLTEDAQHRVDMFLIAKPQKPSVEIIRNV